MEALLNGGADIDIRDRKGKTALDLAREVLARRMSNVQPKDLACVRILEEWAEKREAETKEDQGAGEEELSASSSASSWAALSRSASRLFKKGHGD